jgi:hypothetical protein
MKLPDIFEKEVEPLSVPAGKVIYSEGEKPTAMYKRKTFHFYDRGTPLLWADRNAQNGGTLATNIFARWIS